MKINLQTKYLLIICSFVCIFFIVYLFFEKGTTENEQLKQAHELLENGNFRGANALYQMVLQNSPQNFSAHFGLGMALCSENIFRTELGLAEPEDWYLAIYHMTTAHNIQENDQIKETLGILYFNLGSSYKQEERFDDAIKTLSRSIQYAPDLLKSINLLGALHHQLGNLDQAEIHYTRAVTIQPNFAMGYFNLGALAWAKGDLTKAEQFLQKAINIEPTNSYFKEWHQKAKEGIEE